MGRLALIEDAELIDRLSAVFIEVGFQGASMATLSAATGLKKASLYHRFPGGKEEMAREVLRAAGEWVEFHILLPLAEPSPPAQRVVLLAERLNELYAEGRQACLLNLLSSASIGGDTLFAAEIKEMFEALIGALTRLCRDAGVDAKTSRARAERAVMLLHGSLVLSRGLGSTAPFQSFLKTLPSDLLEAS